MFSYKVLFIALAAVNIANSERIKDECKSVDDFEWNIYFVDEESDISKNKYCYNVCLYSAKKCDITDFIKEWSLLIPRCCCNDEDATDLLEEIICDATTHESCRKKTEYNTNQYGWTWSNFKINEDDGCCQFCIDYQKDFGYNIIPYIHGNYIMEDKYGNTYSGSTIVPDVCGCTERDDAITAEPTSNSLKTPCPTIDPELVELANIAKQSISTGLSSCIDDSINTKLIDDYIHYLLSDDFNYKLRLYRIDNVKQMTDKYIAYTKANELIKARNAMNLSYKLQHTFMSDLLDYELQNFYGYIEIDDQQSPDKSDYCHDNLQFTGTPPSGWRNAPVSAIKDQSTCESCWDFAALSSLETMIHENSGVVHDLSEQMALDCNGFFSHCDGGNPAVALSWIKDIGGICTETDYEWPYGAAVKQCKSESCDIELCTAPDAVYCLPSRASKFGQNTNDINEIIRNIKSAVLLGGVAVGFGTTASFDQYSHDGTDSDIFQCLPEDVVRGQGHAMTIVGYTSDFWIMRNSWGTTPTNTGYVYWKIKDSLEEDYCGLYRGAPVFPYQDVNVPKCSTSFVGPLPPPPDVANLVLNVAPNFKCRVYLYEDTKYNGDIYGWYRVGQYQWTNPARITIRSITISSRIVSQLPIVFQAESPSSSRCKVKLYEFMDYSGKSIELTGPAAIEDLSPYVPSDFDSLTLGTLDLQSNTKSFLVGAMIVV